MNSTTGVITALPGIPEGEYQFPYTICEAANPSNCDNAVAYIKVNASDILAVEDKDGGYGTVGTPINGYTGGKTPTVLENDLLNSNPAHLGNVNLIPGDSPHSGLTMNPDGTITVAPGT